MDVAGMVAPKALPCPAPYSRQRDMSVTNILVRTTSGRPAPSCSSAAATLAMHWLACASASPSCTSSPSTMDVHPDTNTKSPAATARLYPTTASHGAPLDTFLICPPRGRFAWSCRRRARRWSGGRVLAAGTPQRPWRCVVPEARLAALRGVRPGGCGVPVPAELTRYVSCDRLQGVLQGKSRRVQRLADDRALDPQGGERCDGPQVGQARHAAAGDHRPAGGRAHPPQQVQVRPGQGAVPGDV